MKKLMLKAQALGANELLGKEQMKKIMGGSSGSGASTYCGRDYIGGCCDVFCGPSYPQVTCSGQCSKCEAAVGTGGSVCS